MFIITDGPVRIICHAANSTQQQSPLEADINPVGPESTRRFVTRI